MPWKLRGRCRHQGCAVKAGETGYCDAHHKVFAFKERIRQNEAKKHRLATDPEELERYRFYKSKRWSKLRKMQLASEPLCRQCGKAAHVVDHIIQIRKGGDRYDQDNLQSLCTTCHNKKRAQESQQAMLEKKYARGTDDSSVI